MQSEIDILVIPIVITFLVTIIGVPILRRVLMAKNVIDTPNARSSHTRPTPRGGGIVVLFSIIIGIAILQADNFPLPQGLLVMVLVAFALGCVSWIDDMRSLSPVFRLGCQIVAVGTALSIDPELAITSIPYVPHWLATMITAAVWVWFINLYNFMDGIDGMTSVETVTICLGIGLLGTMGTLSNDIVAPIAIIGTAGFAFLFWNWSPAKIFLGDVGSIPLGFLLGWALIQTANQGAWAAAMIIPGYYLADATITILRRAARGEKIWTPHRQHFYQMPVAHHVSHDRIMMRIIIANALLVSVAVWGLPLSEMYGFVAGGLIIAGLLWHLSRFGRP